MLAAAPQAGTPFGPEAGGQIAVVNPIGTILNTFKVSLVGKTCTSSAFAHQLDASLASSEMSSTLRPSIEHVRAIKIAHARRLLDSPAVVAVGIGAGDTPDTAALNVYLQNDSEQIRRKILSEINGATEIKFKHARRFRAL
jgi:hypothetical protein